MCTCVPKSLLTGPLQSKLNIINAEMAYDIASLASSQCAATFSSQHSLHYVRSSFAHMIKYSFQVPTTFLVVASSLFRMMLSVYKF